MFWLSLQEDKITFPKPIPSTISFDCLYLPICFIGFLVMLRSSEGIMQRLYTLVYYRDAVAPEDKIEAQSV